MTTQALDNGKAKYECIICLNFALYIYRGYSEPLLIEYVDKPRGLYIRKVEAFFKQNSDQLRQNFIAIIHSGYKLVICKQPAILAE